MRIGITGFRGQLGVELCRRLPGTAIPLDVDITSRAEVVRALHASQPDVVINAAAYTAVDDAEVDSKACFDVNTLAVRMLAEETRDIDCRLLHISTDYVFDATEMRRPLVETDSAQPTGKYAQSKRQSEIAAAVNPRHLTIRTCGLYGLGVDNRAKNFVRTMMRLGASRDHVSVVNDQRCNPTSVLELVNAIEYLLHREDTGVLHVVNAEPLTWCEFARHILAIAGLACDVVPITTAEFGAKAPRPAYSVLDTRRYESLGGPEMSSCRAAVARFIELHQPSVPC